MGHDTDLILTLTGGLTAALILGFIAQRVKLSPIVGYLLAGVVVGPFTPGFVAQHAIAEQFAELGVILLMFGVGLHFHIHELIAVGRVVIPGALTVIAATVGFGLLATRLFSWSFGSGIFYGLTICMTSTVVLLRVMSDNDATQSPLGRLSISWLVVEDLFAVLALVLLPLAYGPSQGGLAAVKSVTFAVAKIALLVVFALVAGRMVIPRLLGYVAKTRSRELFTLTVLVLALGIAVGAAKLFGASMALGAFLAGTVVGQTDFSTRAASEALPMRDAFAVLFFVAMGMLLDPRQLMSAMPLTLATLAVVLVAKPLFAVAVLRVLGKPARTALPVGVALGQIGEFTFILATLGTTLRVLPPAATQSLVATSIVSITLSPVLFGIASRYAHKARTSIVPNGVAPSSDGAHTAIVVGYGPVGRSLVALLRESEIDPIVIELNHQTLQTLRAAGVRALYGDASQREVLERAGITEATSLIYSASGTPEAVLRLAKELNPSMLLIARATYASEVAPLQKAGAQVVAGETEVALAMAERLMRRLGATDESIDRARDRVRELVSTEASVRTVAEA